MPTFLLCIKVKEGAGSEEKKGVYVTSLEEHELTGSKGTANLVMKFAKGSKKEASVNVMEVKGVTRPYTAEDDGKFVPIIAFECRGLEPIGFHPEGGWNVVSGGGSKFQDVDLKELEWTDYCDKSSASVGVFGFESKFQLHRG